MAQTVDVSAEKPFKAISIVLLVAMLLWLSPVENLTAADELNNAQTLIYDTPHLAQTSAGQKLVYAYQATQSDGTSTAEKLEDTVTLSVIKEHDELRRDLSIHFLTDERRLAFPDFPSFKGNPVIIAMLEHISRYMGVETGGGVVYFRNRIRDAMAGKSVSVEQSDLQFNGQTIKGERIGFKPFIGDTYLTRWPELLDTTITIELSDSVPGNLLRIEVATGPDGELSFNRQLVATK